MKDKSGSAAVSEHIRLSHSILRPKHPERVCWGCDKYCPADRLRCGNGTERTQHPVELFGEDWDCWADQRERD